MPNILLEMPQWILTALDREWKERGFQSRADLIRQTMIAAYDIPIPEGNALPRIGRPKSPIVPWKPPLPKRPDTTGWPIARVNHVVCCLACQRGEHPHRGSNVALDAPTGTGRNLVRYTCGCVQCTPLAPVSVPAPVPTGP